MMKLHLELQRKWILLLAYTELKMPLDFVLVLKRTLVVLAFGLCLIICGPFWSMVRDTVEISFSNGFGNPVRETPIVSDFPNIIHQIWIPYSKMPHRWNSTMNSIRAFNRNMTYKLWTYRDIEQLFAEDYPWFIETFYSYRENVQRVDAARYFILLKYGGVYIDMDITNKVSFSSIIGKHGLSSRQCMLAETKPVGVATDIIMCKRASPFMAFVTSRLSASNRWFIVPYTTVIFATGPMFLSKALCDFQDKDDIFVLDYELKTRNYFHHVAGNTWHRWDAAIILFCYEVIRNRTAMIAGLLLCLCCFVFRKRIRTMFRC